MYENLTYEVADPIATITLNRPERLNALTGPLLEELARAIGEAENDPAVVAILLTGAGRGFCAGADMDGLKSTADSDGGPVTRQLEQLPGDVAMGDDFSVTYGYLLRVRKPILAAINGACAGLGFAIAMLCDLRFAAEGAKFTTAFANRGLVAEHGVSWMLPRLIGPANALDLLWSGRKFLADEAQQLGVVNRVCPADSLLDESRAYLEMLAANSAPNSLRSIKAQVYRHLNMGLGDSMRETNDLMAESLQHEDFKEGVNSYLERRPPKFERVP
ncbi:MAG: enoyl-CoA hydratase [Acidobacteriota bacterium]